MNQIPAAIIKVLLTAAGKFMMTVHSLDHSRHVFSFLRSGCVIQASSSPAQREEHIAGLGWTCEHDAQPLRGRPYGLGSDLGLWGVMDLFSITSSRLYQTERRG